MLVILAPMAMADTKTANAASAIPSDVKLEKATNPVIKISTQRGDMILELFPDSAATSH